MTPDSLQRAPLRGEFGRCVALHAPSAARAERIDTVMLNVGLICNTTCGSCHHACSPGRTETMSADVMAQALELLGVLRPQLLDVTGGEPALWPRLRELLLAARSVGLERIRVRTNLTGLVEPTAVGVAEFLAAQRVELLASLPALPLDSAPDHVQVLATLRGLGYGDGSAGTIPLDLAHVAPVDADARAHSSLDREYRAALAQQGAAFRSLLDITGVPLGALDASLRQQGRCEAYLSLLRERFNPAVLMLLDCRSTVEIAWDGTLWDCDFNLAAGTPLAHRPNRLAAILADPEALQAIATRRIAFGQHCFACTAGAGSG